MRNNYNIINVTALERLPEKHYAHLNWSPEQKKTTQILIHFKKKRKETGAETNINMCSSSAG